MNKKIKDSIKYWEDSSKDELKVAKNLFKLKHYSQCLFFCHLSLEKILKALVVTKIEDYPPYTHDLRKLAEIAGIVLNSEQKEILDIIFTFNISGRYANEKEEFYKEYDKKPAAEKYLKITEKLILWLKKEFPKKK